MRAFDTLTATGRLRRLRSVAVAALREYDVPDCRLSLVADSFNTVFRVSSAGATYLLRVGPEREIHEPGSAGAEQRWTSELAARGLPVPRIISGNDGGPSTGVAVAGAPGRRECMLLAWRPGRPLARPVPTGDVVELATLSADLHDASPPIAARPAGVLDGRNVLHFRLPDLLDDAPETVRGVLRAALDRARDALEAMWRRASEPPRLIHSDLTPNNVVRSRSRLAAIDFQDMTWGHLEQDLANTLYGITRGVDMTATLDVFRASYERRRSWPDLGPDLLADLVAARRLEMVNLAIFLRRDGLPDYLERHAAALRTYAG